MPEAVRTVQNDISGEIYMTKDILVRVRGVQTIGEEEDTVEMITPGTYYVKNGKQYLIYDESLDETGTPTHNTVKVMENRIEVMKRGLSLLVYTAAELCLWTRDQFERDIVSLFLESALKSQPGNCAQHVILDLKQCLIVGFHTISS